jgi:hypothetical protein
MKQVLHKSKKDVFSTWLNDYFILKQSKYIWAQICYEWKTGDLLHVVFEKNSANEAYIQWPVHIPNIAVTNIDFTNGSPTLNNGEPWEYQSWHIDALNCDLLKEPSTEPISFWDWRLQTRPQGNATCDLDFMCKTIENKYIGIEATEIYYVDISSNVNQDVFEHFQRLLKLRKGSSPGFNLKQLKAQNNFVQIFGGRMFMLFHQILKDQQPYRLREDKCLLLEIDDENYRRIETIVSQSAFEVHEPAANYTASRLEENPMQGIKRDIRFASLEKIIDRFVD